MRIKITIIMIILKVKMKIIKMITTKVMKETKRKTITTKKKIIKKMKNQLQNLHQMKGELTKKQKEMESLKTIIK